MYHAIEVRTQFLKAPSYNHLAWLMRLHALTCKRILVHIVFIDVSYIAIRSYVTYEAVINNMQVSLGTLVPNSRD